jgi:citrate synthase
MSDTNEVLASYVRALGANISEEYAIPQEAFEDQNIKRGLRNADGTGVIAGVSKVGSVQGYYVEDGQRVPMPGKLYYRGISVEDIIEAHRKNGTFGFEEVAYLLLLGHLPTREQEEQFLSILTAARKMPDAFTEDMILKAPSRDIMNQLARSVLALYTFDDQADDISPENLLRQSIELIARFPLIAANAYAAKRHYFDGKSLYLHNPNPELSVAENLLRMIRKDKSYTPVEAHLLDLMLILHAEHSSNNSTFACRVLSSTGTDTYSAIAGAVGSLKGPLHGGANSRVMKMFSDLKQEIGAAPNDETLGRYLDAILDGRAGDRSGKIYGLGHAVYTMSDPRAVVIKKYAAELAGEKGMMGELDLMERVEKMGIEKIMARKHQTMPMCANVDMYSGLVYSMLDIPADLYTPIFACARISGWCAHRIEEVVTGGRIMRPAYRAAVKRSKYIPMEERA